MCDLIKKIKKCRKFWGVIIASVLCATVLLYGLSDKNIVIYLTSKEFQESLSAVLSIGVQIATIVGVIGIIFHFAEVCAEHERGRKEKAVEYLWNWSTSLQPETLLVRKIVDKLSEEDCRKLNECRAVKIPKAVKKEFRTLRPYLIKNNPGVRESLQNKTEEKTAENNSVQKSKKNRKLKRKTTPEESVVIRGLAINYLNHVEAILTGWQYAVLDKDIIEAEFSYLFEKKDAFYGLKNLRDVLGGQSSYPAIASFEAYVQNKKEKQLINESNIM